MNLLLSYAFHRAPGWEHALRCVHEQGGATLVDSGAFTAHSIGARVTLAGYCNFLRRNLGAVDEYIALDVVGDRHKTVETYREMVKLGLRPMGVVTNDMTAEQAQEYLEHNPRICAAGGSRGVACLDWYPQKMELIQRLSDRRARIHALGFTPNGYEGFKPVASADSSSWSYVLRFGGVTWWDPVTCQMERTRWDSLVGVEPPAALATAMANSNVDISTTGRDFYKLSRGAYSFAAYITAAAWMCRLAYAQNRHGLRLYLSVTQPSYVGLLLQAMKHGAPDGSVDFEAIMGERKQLTGAIASGHVYARRYTQQAFDAYRKNFDGARPASFWGDDV